LKIYLSVPEIQGTTQEVALAKVKAAAQALKGPCITEDTALCFKAMNGLPGPFIKYFLKELGHEGMRHSISLCIGVHKLTIVNLKGLNTMLSGFPTKEATALCTFGYCAGPDSEPLLFEGETEGSIVDARGPKNFGWVSERFDRLSYCFIRSLMNKFATVSYLQ
jgi:inosine triphosphate pyrophosphatase